MLQLGISYVKENCDSKLAGRAALASSPTRFAGKAGRNFCFFGGFFLTTFLYGCALRTKPIEIYRENDFSAFSKSLFCSRNALVLSENSVGCFFFFF